MATRGFDGLMQKMSVPEANDWIVNTERVGLRLAVVLDSRQVPSGREQHARLHRLAAELERRSEGQEWTVNVHFPELWGGHHVRMGVAIEPSSADKAEQATAEKVLAQLKKDIDTSVFRFSLR